jgi:hypothetical protein
MPRTSSTAKLEDRPQSWRTFRPSIWTFVAPVALAACVFVILSIARDAGWTGRGHAVKQTRTIGSGSSSQAGGAILYRAKPGDTLMAIAVRFGISVESLRALNPKVPADGAVPTGRRIRLR